MRDKSNEESIYAFELSSKEACKHLWRCAVDHHLFFTGRSEKSDTPVEREEPAFDRVPSRRYQRRVASALLEQEANLGEATFYEHDRDYINA